MLENLKHRILITILFVLSAVIGVAQNAVLKGVVTDEFGDPIETAFLRVLDYNQQTISNEHGQYSLTLPANRDLRIFVQHLGHSDTLVSLRLSAKETRTMDLVLRTTGERLEAVKIQGAAATGYVQVNPKLSFQLPSPTGGMESLIKMLPGTSSNNELSAQYNVRGGNFDENLVFVNGIQIYRPFLVRNAQQLSLIHI